MPVVEQKNYEILQSSLGIHLNDLTYSMAATIFLEEMQKRGT